MSTYRNTVRENSLIILSKRISKEKFLLVKMIDGHIELFAKAKRIAIRKIKGTLEEPYFIFNNSRYNLEIA